MHPTPVTLPLLTLAACPRGKRREASRERCLAARTGLATLLAFPLWSFAADAPAASSNSTPTISTNATAALPREWVDPATGHRIVRLSEQDNSQSLYFHQNPYTPDGTRLVVTVPDGIATINLKTREIKKFTLGQAPTQRIDTHVETPFAERIGHVVVGRKTPTVYYTKGASVMATNLDTGVTRQITTLPSELVYGSGFTVNADESLLVGTGNAEAHPATAAPNADPTAPTGEFGSIGPRWTGNQGLPQRLAAVLPMVLYSINIKTGEINKFFRAEHDWLNHVQFSPTDPNLLMFCHEGPWERVDRVWQISLDQSPYTVKPGDTLASLAAARGTDIPTLKAAAHLTSDDIQAGQILTLPPPAPRLVHQRSMVNEIAGHEFWGADGQNAWYDLQTPKSTVFWVGGMNLATGQHLRYSLPKNQWSVHFNVSPDGKFFAGDGGGPNSVARGDNGQWVFLFTPDQSHPETLTVNGEAVTTYQFQAERLASLAKHDYGLEPNVSFTPDMKWIVFRSNMLGADHGSHVFAVELAKATAATPPVSTP